MTERTLNGADAKPGMHDFSDIASLVEIQPESTVYRTVLQAEGAHVVLFSFDAGQVMTEHTAAVPVLQVLDGHLRITADGRTVDLSPGGLMHLTARLPHAVEASEASRLQLTMLDGCQPEESLPLSGQRSSPHGLQQSPRAGRHEPGRGPQGPARDLAAPSATVRRSVRGATERLKGVAALSVGPRSRRVPSAQTSSM
jgi:quercetin dioxygenase-like cupin family protein